VTVVLNQYSNQCPVLCSQRNRMKLVIERPWCHVPSAKEDLTRYKALRAEAKRTPLCFWQESTSDCLKLPGTFCL